MLDPEVELPNSMIGLFEEEYSPKIYQQEELIQGEVVRVDEDGIIMSVGLKTEGIITPQEMRLLKRQHLDSLKSGDKLSVVFLSGGGPAGLVQLSYDCAQIRHSWSRLSDHFADRTTINARIIEVNKGGVSVDYEGISGFVPFSHLKPLDSEESRLETRLGQISEFNVIEIDESKERLVLSERAIWQAQKEEQRKNYLNNLEPGSRVSGTVTSLRGFGAFIDLGPADGLIPMSELSWSMLKSADEVLSIGEAVDLIVLNVDNKQQRITLSLKRTTPEPWETVHERYSKDQIVEGKVTRLVEFGAFVKVEEWVEGLIHMSELSNRQIKSAKECVYVGQNVRVMIIGIDQQKRRMSLSYKKAYGM